MSLEAGKTLEPRQGSRLVQPSQAMRRDSGGFRDAAVLRNELCGKPFLRSGLKGREEAKAAACLSRSGAEEASPRCFFSTAFIEDTEDEEAIPSELQAAPSSISSRQRPPGEKRGGGGSVLRVAYDADSHRREVTLIRGSKDYERLGEAGGSLASPTQHASPQGALPPVTPADAKHLTTPSSAHARQQQQQLLLQKDALVQAEARMGDVESASCLSLRAAAGSCLLPPSQQSQQLHATPTHHPVNSLVGQVISQAPAACVLKMQQPSADIHEGPLVGGGATGPHCFLAGPSPMQQMHAAAPDLSPARAAAPVSNGCSGLPPVTPVSAWPQVQQQQHMQHQQLQHQMQQQQMQQQHMQGGAGVSVGPLYPAVGQALWGPPAFSFGQPCWLGAPWVPQRHVAPPPSLCYAGSSHSCLPLGAGPGTLSQQGLQRSTSAACSGALRRSSIGGLRRSRTTSSEQFSQRELHEGPSRAPQSHEPQQLLLSQHLQHRLQQQQQGVSHSVVYAQLGQLPVHPEPNEQPRRSALNATLPTVCQRSSSCSRLTNRGNCLPSQWGPEGPLGFQAEWGPPYQEQAGETCCLGVLHKPIENEGRGAPLNREASRSSQTQEGAPLPHPLADAFCQTFQKEAAAGPTGAAAAPGGRSSAAAMIESCCTATQAAATAAAAAKGVDGGSSLRESPAAIGGRILRRLQTLKDLLEGHETRGALLAEGIGAPIPTPERPPACGSHHSHAVPEKPRAEGHPADPDTCIHPEGALHEGPPAGPLQDRTVLDEGTPICAGGEAVSAASVEEPGSCPASSEDGLSLIAAGVPRLTLAMLNSSGGLNGPGKGGATSLSLPPRRGPPSSVLQAPRRPASPEPLEERPGRGPLRRQRGEGDSTGSSAALHREANQQRGGGEARQMKQHHQDPSHVLREGSSQHHHLLLSNHLFENAPRGLLGPPPTSQGASRTDGEAAGGRGGPLSSEESGVGDGTQQVQVASSSLRVAASVFQSGGATVGSDAEGLQRYGDSWQEQTVSSPASVSVSRRLQQQRVKWALWTGSGLSAVGGLGEDVLNAEEVSGVRTPGNSKPQQGTVSAYPSLPVAVGGCRSSRLDFYLPVAHTSEETGGRGLEAHHQMTTGLAVCEKEGLRLMVLWEGLREIIDPHAQILVLILEELHARGDPKGAMEAAFEKVSCQDAFTLAT
ncbi:hypothetical protein ACSSS7_001473 [Eimeria intestinalis]